MAVCCAGNHATCKAATITSAAVQTSAAHREQGFCFLTYTCMLVDLCTLIPQALCAGSHLARLPRKFSRSILQINNNDSSSPGASRSACPCSASCLQRCGACGGSTLGGGVLLGTIATMGMRCPADLNHPSSCCNSKPTIIIHRIWFLVNIAKYYIVIFTLNTSHFCNLIAGNIHLNDWLITFILPSAGCASCGSQPCVGTVNTMPSDLLVCFTWVTVD